MAGSLLGGGLVFEESLPVVWTPGPLVEGASLARLNADNYQLLGAEASLDEVRVHDALKEESAALVHELQRLEYKVNILLRLTAELAMRHSALPSAQPVRLSPRAMEWIGPHTPMLGDTGLLALYINAALPQPLRLPCTVAAQRDVGDGRTVELHFAGLSDAVTDMLEKLVFRHHRRLVAGARLSGT